MDMVTPGPGEYATHLIRHTVPGRSILGGKIKKDDELEENNLPGPGSYETGIKDHITGYKIMKKTKRKKKRREALADTVGPASYSPINPTHFSKGPKIGTGQRNAGESKDRRPGPGQHNTTREFG
jgi:hypothetical protein